MASSNQLNIDVDEARRVVVLKHQPPLAISAVTIEVPFPAWSHVAAILLQRHGLGTASGIAPAAIELPTAQQIGDKSH